MELDMDLVMDMYRAMDKLDTMDPGGHMVVLDVDLVVDQSVPVQRWS